MHETTSPRDGRPRRQHGLIGGSVQTICVGRASRVYENNAMIENDNAIDDSTMNNSSEQRHGRYGSFVNEDEVIVYDRENPTRWIQSDVAVELDALR